MRGGSPPIVDLHALCSIAGAPYKPRTPHWTKANTPCSQRLRRRDRLRKLYEPRTSLPVRPGGLCRRRLDGTLSVSYYIQSPLGGGLRNTYRDCLVRTYRPLSKSRISGKAEPLPRRGRFLNNSTPPTYISRISSLQFALTLNFLFTC